MKLGWCIVSCVTLDLEATNLLRCITALTIQINSI